MILLIVLHKDTLSCMASYVSRFSLQVSNFQMIKISGVYDFIVHIQTEKPSNHFEKKYANILLQVATSDYL